MANGIFPTLGELLLPNWNIFTVLGIFAFILAAITFIPQVKVILRAINIKPIPFAVIAGVVGVVLVWGVSIVQDFLSSLGGILIFWGLVLTIITYFILFGNDKK